MPGWNPPIYSKLARPEPVVPAHELDALRQAASQPVNGNTYHFGFRDTTLTPAKLRAMQDADAAYARVGRPR